MLVAVSIKVGTFIQMDGEWAVQFSLRPWGIGILTTTLPVLSWSSA